MPRNIEIKVRLEGPAHLEAVRAQAASLADGPEVVIDQDDTFFPARHGRLKLRAFADGSGELIHYERADSTAARSSDYVRVPVPDPENLRSALSRGLGVLGRVRKRRWLFLVGATRVHLDAVEGLGAFVELEVVLADNASDGHSDDHGVGVAEALLAALGLRGAPRVAVAYLDLLAGHPGAGASA